MRNLIWGMGKEKNYNSGSYNLRIQLESFINEVVRKICNWVSEKNLFGYFKFYEIFLRLFQYRILTDKFLLKASNIFLARK